MDLRHHYTSEELAQAVTDLNAAAEYIHKFGWTQQVYITHDKACCAAGALNRTINVVPGDEDLWDHHSLWGAAHFSSRSAVAVGIFHKLHGMDIATFNDSVATRAEEVIEKLHETSAHVRALLEEVPA